MCVILSIYQKEKDFNICRKILRSIELFKEQNKDGIAVVGLNFDNEKWFYRRNLDISKNDLEKVLLNYDVVNLHLRSATSGEVKDDNIHFWKAGNWFFAHNGVIHEFDKEGLCDSLVLFKELLNRDWIRENGKINFNRIKTFVNTLNFWGRFILINKNTKRIYYFGDFKVNSLNKKVLTISTSELDLADEFKLFGFWFKDLNEIRVIGGEVEGIYYIDLKKRDLRIIDEEFLKNRYSYYGFNRNCKQFKLFPQKNNEYYG